MHVKAPQLVYYTSISQVCANFYTLGWIYLINQQFSYPLELMLVITEYTIQPLPIKLSQSKKTSQIKSNKLGAQSLEVWLIEYQGE